MGAKLDDLIVRLDPEEVAIAVNDLRSGRKVAYECRVRRKNGDVIWVSVVAAPVRDEDGRIGRMVGSSTNITQRKSLEAQFLQAQKMDAVGRLAGGIAHDFNNLLTVIGANVDFLEQGLPRESELAGDAREIARATKRAAELTRQLLTFSRQQGLQQHAVDVNVVLRELEKMLSRLIAGQVTLVLELQPDVPAVLVDPGQLEQAIVNLVVNARDAMPDGGVVRISTRRVVREAAQSRRQQDAPPGLYTAIVVTDTGSGMTADVRARVFEPFFTTKEAGKGTGLGLATVYGIVRQSKGFLDVESAVGVGSTFTIYLPETTEAADAIEGAPTSGYGGNERVLLVEDQDEVRAVAFRILSSAGYHVTEATNGAEALRLLEGRSISIDLVLTDVMMPGMSGTELKEAVRLRWPAMPVAMMSGFAGESSAEAPIPDMPSRLLQKPFTRDQLLAAVREALNHADA